MTKSEATNRYVRGSEWRKWDLHVHSPSSYEYSGSWDQFEEQLSSANCSVIGITDYFSIKGYQRIKKRVKSGDLDLGIKKILPVVEFRMRDILKNKHTGKSGTNINFQVIFDDSIATSKIETFIKSLEVDGSQIANKYNNPKFLKETANVYYEQDVINKLNNNKDFRGKFLVWLPYNEYGGIDEIDPKTDDWIKRGFIKKADLIGSSNRKQTDFFLWNSPKKKNGKLKYSQKQLKKWFKMRKPCIKGSDSHNHNYPIGRLKDKDSKPSHEYCWIKADPTFEGLKQIVYEPSERVKIQELKPQEKDSYRVISKVIIKDKKHFPKEVVFGSFLCSIIGSRSSGKSALLTLVGYSVDSKLSKERNEVVGLIGEYVKGYKWEDAPEVLVEWEDGVVTKPEEDNTKRIYYLPQNYLFSGYNKTEDITRLIKPLLFNREPTLETEYQKLQTSLENDAKKNKQQIADLINCKEGLATIDEKLKNVGDKEEIKKAIKLLDNKIKGLRKTSQLTESDVTTYKSIIRERNKKRLELRTIKNDLNLLEQFPDEFEISVTPLPDNLSEKTHEKLVSSIDKTIEKSEEVIRKNIQDFVNRRKKEKGLLKKNIEKINKDNKELFQKVKKAQELKEVIGEKMALEKKVIELEKLEIRKIRISTSLEDTLKLISNSIIKREKRIEELSGAINHEVDTGLTIKSEVVRDEHKIEIICNKLNYSYSGLKEKRKYWKKGDNFYRFRYDVFIKKPKEFLKDLLEEKVKIKKETILMDVFETVCEVISSVDFVAEFEKDRIGGRKPSTMTPGKKALVALKLALGNTEEKWPLLIDQPEDNLDSRSISSIVVKFLIEKKKERQIIMVSHDANLVVCGDSEQVIVANRKGSDRPNEDKRTFNYGSGSLENTSLEDGNIKDTLKQKGIREHVCEILEGGEDAFDKRAKKYSFKSKENDE